MNLLDCDSVDVFVDKYQRRRLTYIQGDEDALEVKVKPTVFVHDWCAD